MIIRSIVGRLKLTSVEPSILFEEFSGNRDFKISTPTNNDAGNKSKEY
jgi:hypothetical protein